MSSLGLRMIITSSFGASLLLDKFTNSQTICGVLCSLVFFRRELNEFYFTTSVVSFFLFIFRQTRDLLARRVDSAVSIYQRLCTIDVVENDSQPIFSSVLPQVTSPKFGFDFRPPFPHSRSCFELTKQHISVSDIENIH